ncbi:hypothetical protein FACS1894122_04750 [Alphaproteobacteria bacterium]|nr:hypothetical protein FACS1894122_04750 [Alphaproteobacteria bacterium]
MKNGKITKVLAGRAFAIAEAASTPEVQSAYISEGIKAENGASVTLAWYDDNCIEIGNSVGIDEVGRGPLAGPVVSAAVWICADLAKYLEENSKILPIRDSKKMTRKQRQRVIDWIDRCSSDQIKYSIGFATVEEIDELNILNASLLSMERAYSSVGSKAVVAPRALTIDEAASTSKIALAYHSAGSEAVVAPRALTIAEAASTSKIALAYHSAGSEAVVAPRALTIAEAASTSKIALAYPSAGSEAENGSNVTLALVDGNIAPNIKGVEIKTIVRGDEKVLSISLASIIAKEYRDNYMRNLSEQFPHYSWDTNVGYGTTAHLRAIAKYGITPHHRKSFSPVSQLSLLPV